MARAEKLNQVMQKKKIKADDFARRQRAVNLASELNYSCVTDEFSRAKCRKMYLNDHWANKSNKSFWSYWDLLVPLFEPTKAWPQSAVRSAPTTSLTLPSSHRPRSSPTKPPVSVSESSHLSVLCLNVFPRSPHSAPPIFVQVLAPQRALLWSH